jgi:hypothetical protein
MIKQAKPHQQVARPGNKATSQAAAVLDNSDRSKTKPRLSKATLCWWIWTRRKPAMPTRRTCPTKAEIGGRLCEAASGGDAEPEHAD